MSIIQFTALPLPHFLNSGFNWAEPGRKHPDRCALGEFDLLVVLQGCLYVGEEDRHYEVSAGHALVLRPDLHHYPTAGCTERTASYWLHFHTAGQWGITSGEAEGNELEGTGEKARLSFGTFHEQTFQIRIPQFSRLLQPSKMYEYLRQLNALEQDSHLDGVRWRREMLFQEILMQLGDSLQTRPLKRNASVADQAASYLRTHYREPVTVNDLGLALSFHPVYIARCMQKQFGCSSMEYLLRYRLEQAKLLLLQTDLSVSHIAQEVGFQQAAYFTSCFGKWEGLTPRQYRQRFVGKR